MSLGIMICLGFVGQGTEEKKRRKKHAEGAWKSTCRLPVDPWLRVRLYTGRANSVKPRRV